MTEALCALLGALVGGLITGHYTLRGVREQYRLEQEMRETTEKGLIRNFRQMIRTEVQTLWDHYLNDMGREVEGLGEHEPLLAIYPVTQNNYFSVYDNNCASLGSIEDEHLRGLIVKVYTRAKGLLDAFRMNNELIKDYRETDFQRLHFQNLHLRDLAKQKLEALRNYADSIKQEHATMRQLVQDLLNNLNNN